MFLLLKKIFLFILCLLPWFVSSLIPVDLAYYESLKLPFFTPPTIFYSIAWTIVYFLLALSISLTISDYSWKKVPRSYWIALIVNYLFNQSFSLVFWILKSPFLGFVSCCGTFVSCLFLYQETSKFNEKSTKLLDPYVLLSLFATILSMTIYILNTL